jgi:CubicO group peptidase (beta-lactamase class C family)
MRRFIVVVSVIFALFGVSVAQSDEIDRYLSELPPEYFSGTVLIRQDSEELLREGYGFANSEGTAVTPVTVFDIGSITKQFTAAAILHLQERDLLSVEDPITEYLENVPDDKQGITLHHLLTHTSGLEENHVESDLDEITREEALEIILAQGLLSAPGESYAYSNSGYSLLAAVIEIVSGKSYQDYLHENLFAPAQMQSTGFYNDPQWESISAANGYANGEDQGNPATWAGPYWGIIGNGGVMSTVGDLHRWWDALQGGEVLEAESVELLFTPHISQGDEGVFYGYGWTIEDTDYGQLITHNGGGIGGNSDFAYYVDQDLLVIMLTNRIVYREALGFPCRVEVPATETSRQLVANLLSGDFSVQPQPTLAVC